MSSPESPVRENPAIQFAVKRYVLTIGAFIALVLFGLVATVGLPVRLLPNFSLPIVGVQTVYPGGTPEDLERQVSRIIEDAVSSASGVVEIASSSGGGASLVTITFNERTNPDAAANEISQRVAAVRDQLPQAAQAPTVQKFDLNASPILTLAVQKPGEDLRTVFEWADTTLKPQLERVPGVAEVRITGAPRREIQVRLQPANLQAFDLSPAQVVSAIQAAAPDLPAGTVSGASGNVSLSARNQITRLSDLEQTLVDPDRGLRVVDLGVVRDTSSRTEQLTRVNGQPALLIDIRRTTQGNTATVAAAVKQVLANLKAPEGYTVSIPFDDSTIIAKAVSDTAEKAIIAAVAVGILVLLTLGKPYTAIAVMLSIPLSIASAPILFGLMGFSLNVITLLGIIVAMGIVVDDSIVVAENVERYRHQGLGLMQSVTKGAAEVFTPVAAATVALLAVLLPLAAIPGVSGVLFREFGLGVAVTILFSWLVSMFFLTMVMSYIPDPKTVTWGEVAGRLRDFGGIGRWATQRPTHWVGYLMLPLRVVASPLRYLLLVVLNVAAALINTLFVWVEGGLHRLSLGYGSTLGWSLRNSGWVIVIAAAFFLSTFLIFPRIPFAFQSPLDDGYLAATVKLPTGSTLAQTNAVTQQLEAIFRSKPEVEVSQATVGLASDTGGVESWTARVQLKLVPKAQRENFQVLIERYRKELEARFANRPDVEIRVGQGSLGTAGDLVLSLNASSVQVLRERLPQVLAEIRRNPNVVGARSSQAETTQEQVFVSDKSRLAGTGLTPQDVAVALRAFNEGEFAANYRDGANSYRVRVRLAPEAIRDRDSLLALPVFAPELGTNLPLGELGRFQETRSPATINRTNKAYSTTLNITLRPNNPGVLQMQTEIENHLRAKGLLDAQFDLAPAGALSDAALTQGLVVYGGLAVLLSVVLSYLVLGAQFNSFRYPVYLLLPVPLAILGGVWGLFFFRTGIDVFTVLGMVVLLGLAIKNAILLLDFAIQRSRLESLAEALIDAGKLRLRPILMTSAAAVVTAIPIIAAEGDGAELRRGLGIVLLFGMIVSTILTLYVVPAVFYRFERGRMERKEQPTRAKPVPVAGD
ncbi:MAG: efflux RND transporter permease subunit [Meiothermus sp.]|nr:efflux RND transporter permease subunit [Meiothermus sp.]